jgi:hypothetical protein
LVENCHSFDATVENLLEDFLTKIYKGKEASFYYCFMHQMAKKFDNVCHFLNERRIVGRIMDLTFATIIG